MPLTVDACVAQHQGDRKEQQDRVAILAHPRQRGVALAVLADGMGGHTGGALAAEQVVHTAKTSFEHYSVSEDLPASLLYNSMEEAHTMIRASRFMNEMDPHSTAVMLLVQPGRVTWGHCGDSRLYHFRDGRPVDRTRDHSYVEHLVATGRITAEQALTHRNRNVLISCLGGQEAPQVAIGACDRLTGGDAFVLCSDGLWAYFEDDEFARLVHENSARDACETLIAKARQRAGGSGDNLSLAIVKLLEVAPAVPPPGGLPRSTPQQ